MQNNLTILLKYDIFSFLTMGLSDTINIIQNELVIVRNIYMIYMMHNHIYIYMIHLGMQKHKESMNLNENGKWYMGCFTVRKVKGEM